MSDLIKRLREWRVTDEWVSMSELLLAEAAAALEAAEAERDKLRELLKRVVIHQTREDRACNGNAPGHGHSRPGIWDADNAPGMRDMPCDWCATWREVLSALSQSERT